MSVQFTRDRVVAETMRWVKIAGNIRGGSWLSRRWRSGTSRAIIGPSQILPGGTHARASRVAEVRSAPASADRLGQVPRLPVVPVGEPAVGAQPLRHAPRVGLRRLPRSGPVETGRSPDQGAAGRPAGETVGRAGVVEENGGLGLGPARVRDDGDPGEQETGVPVRPAPA